MRRAVSAGRDAVHYAWCLGIEKQNACASCTQGGGGEAGLVCSRGCGWIRGIKVNSTACLLKSFSRLRKVVWGNESLNSGRYFVVSVVVKGDGWDLSSMADLNLRFYLYWNWWQCMGMKSPLTQTHGMRRGFHCYPLCSLPSLPCSLQSLSISLLGENFFLLFLPSGAADSQSLWASERLRTEMQHDFCLLAFFPSFRSSRGTFSFPLNAPQHEFPCTGMSRHSC